MTPALFAAYTYYYTDTFTSIDSTKWITNGAVGSGSGLTSSSAGSVISKVSVPDGTDEYEIKTVLQMGGNGYFHYLRASDDALYSPDQGTYYSVEFFPSGSYGTLQAYKRSSGAKTLMGQTTTTASSGMTLRSVIRNDGGAAYIRVYVNDVLSLYLNDGPALTGGKPGIGISQSGSGSISQVDLGPLDRISPSSVSGASTSAFPARIDIQWPAASDDANGIGVTTYALYRDYVWVGDISATTYSDQSLNPNTTYTYQLQAIDAHGNLASALTFTSATLPTNPAQAILPMRTGVKPLGSYWGAGGEQIDTLTGNLNWTLPLVKAIGRANWGVTFALNYNSQTWRKDSGGTWKFGRNIGYGFGWRLMAGALTPYWSTAYTLSKYIFTDATGAEYDLDQTTGNGVWRTKQGLYLEYDANTNKLYFPDGSFWLMGCTSDGTEPDAGTKYPTLMQDSNGNQVFIRYNTGLNAAWPDTSARIKEIEDVRARPNGSTYATYTFTYSTFYPDPQPYLTAINTLISDGASYTLWYQTGQSLSSPFTPPVSYGTTTLLQSIIASTGATTSFEYAGGAGEMSKVTMPYAGTLRWDYRSFTFTGNKTVREVQNRYLKKATGATETTYPFLHDDSGDASRVIHSYTCLNDPSGVGQKCWFFDTNAGAWTVGLNTSYEDRPAPSQTSIRKLQLTWVQDSQLRPYVGTVLSTIDQGAAYQKQAKTEQTLDSYGNLTQTKIYDWGNLTTPAKTYTHTYLTDFNYT